MLQRAEEVAELEVQPRPRRIGILGTPTSSSAHGSAPPAGDRSQGEGIGVRSGRLSPARGGQVPWARRRPRRHTVQPRPRGTGCTAFCRTVEPVYSSPRARTSAPRRDRLGPGLLCPSLSEQRCMPRRHHRLRVLCPPRAGVATRPAWPGVDCAGRHRGLPPCAVKITSYGRPSGWSARGRPAPCIGVGGVSLHGLSLHLNSRGSDIYYRSRPHRLRPWVHAGGGL